MQKVDTITLKLLSIKILRKLILGVKTTMLKNNKINQNLIRKKPHLKKIIAQAILNSNKIVLTMEANLKSVKVNRKIMEVEV